MKLRALQVSDIPALLEIEKLAHEAPWSEEVFQRCFDAHYLGYGVEYADHLIGFVIFSLQIGECHILNLCVHPKNQRQGLGYRLLIHTLEQAQQLKAEIIFLEVRRSNLAAISLYDKVGFVQVGERKDYYPTDKGHEDALVFALDLGALDDI